MRDIPNLVGYLATENGEIVSVRSGQAVTLSKRIHKGYYVVTVGVGAGSQRSRHRYFVHRLVLAAYKGLPPAGENIARHLNGDSLDNRPSNLAWGTHKSNRDDAVRHGTTGFGPLAPRRKLTQDQVMEIRRQASMGVPCQELANRYGVGRYYIPRIVAGRNWPITEPASEVKAGVPEKSGPFTLDTGRESLFS
ncbi:hypothetical protein CAL14_05520 [Bordetella genomosp. 9]|nr:hypothetical protein CAL14_05520 [Bordetella genomosp. 9]